MASTNNQPDILVTGGTGLLGKAVCGLLDHESVNYIVGTHNPANKGSKYIYLELVSGRGLSEALNSIKTILHLATDTKNPDNDVAGVQTLIKEIKKKAAPIHLIFISIVGIDEVPRNYFRQKLEAELLIKNSGISYSILRATQFHDFVAWIIDSLSKLPFIAIIPKAVVIQPIDVKPVAARLVSMAKLPATMSTSNIGGPETATLGELAVTRYQMQKKNKWIINLPWWGNAGRNMLAGALTTSFIATESKTWAQWLRDTIK